MKLVKPILFSILLLLSLTDFSLNAQAEKTGGINLIIELKSKYSFNETVELLTADAKERSWNIPVIHDLQKSLAKSGKEINPVTVIEICKPEYSGKLLELNYERIISVFMPCRISVYEKNDGKTYVALIDGEALAGNQPQNIAQVMKAASDEIFSIVRKVTESDQLLFEESELEILLHMKEEEKLARDVYVTLYEKWKIPAFSNISKAETIHMDAVIFLLKNYGEDYAQVKEPGSFSDPGFQDLYDQLTSQGSESLKEAYKVGALIEEMDIKDLADYLKIVTNENIMVVFENLKKGSRNHLRAFNRHLVFLGQTYVPQYISQEEFNLIINSPHETGNRYRMRMR